MINYNKLKPRRQASCPPKSIGHDLVLNDEPYMVTGRRFMLEYLT